ncbi:MAG TPA: type IV toxin-antitoxin system AbiEi family antitoxin domain-containing protein [Thermoanaerobaculia bacterium]|nr:type IV toxin-antitoxin system AbiEi family antitoxin domain-containing protein [Thermoanaerobaculia bacterium]
MTSPPKIDARIRLLAKDLGVLRPRDLIARGIPREYAQRLSDRGELIRIGRGLYTLPDSTGSSHRSLAEVSKAVPLGVICLLSALRLHGLTTQNPPEVWIALPNNAWRPSAPPFRVHVNHLSGSAWTEGVEVHTIDGVPVRIYSPAKTVADCFKFRNKIGIDVAVEALRDYLRMHRSGADDLWRFARLNRVGRVIQPYLESVL